MTLRRHDQSRGKPGTSLRFSGGRLHVPALLSLLRCGVLIAFHQSMMAKKRRSIWGNHEGLMRESWFPQDCWLIMGLRCGWLQPCSTTKRHSWHHMDNVKADESTPSCPVAQWTCSIRLNLTGMFTFVIMRTAASNALLSSADEIIEGFALRS